MNEVEVQEKEAAVSGRLLPPRCPICRTLLVQGYLEIGGEPVLCWYCPKYTPPHYIDPV